MRLLLLADPADLHGDAAANFSRLQKNSLARDAHDKPNGGSLVIFNAWGEPAFREIFSCDVLIDAILGSGFQPPVSGVYAEAIAKTNSAPGHVIAVDVPSGVAGDSMDGQTAMLPALTPRHIDRPLPAHVFGDLTSGSLIIAPIGPPPEAIESSLNLEVITPQEIAQLIAPRPRDPNKGMYGHVLVAGGSLGKTGAAAMAGFAALRTGAGLVTVASPRSCLGLKAGYHPEPMTEPLEETDAGSISKEALDQFNRLGAWAKPYWRSGRASLDIPAQQNCSHRGDQVGNGHHPRRRWPKRIRRPGAGTERRRRDFGAHAASW